MTKRKAIAPEASEAANPPKWPNGNPAKEGSIAGKIEALEAEDLAAGRAPEFSRAAFEAAALIRMMRREAGMTQQQLAALLSVKQSRVSELESGLGAMGPSWGMMQRIAASCGATLFMQPPKSDHVVALDLSGVLDNEFALTPLAA